MHGLEIIKRQERILAIIIRKNFTSESKYNFLTPTDFPLQLGANFYKNGETIKRHYHPDKNTEISTVQEFIVVSEGRLKVNFYDDKQEYVTDIILEAGDMILLTSGGHGFETLAETTLVEIKQGPYIEKGDKVLF